MLGWINIDWLACDKLSCEPVVTVEALKARLTGRASKCHLADMRSPQQAVTDAHLACAFQPARCR